MRNAGSYNTLSAKRWDSMATDIKNGNEQIMILEAKGNHLDNSDTL